MHTVDQFSLNSFYVWTSESPRFNCTRTGRFRWQWQTLWSARGISFETSSFYVPTFNLSAWSIKMSTSVHCIEKTWFLFLCFFRKTSLFDIYSYALVPWHFKLAHALKNLQWFMNLFWRLYFYFLSFVFGLETRCIGYDTPFYDCSVHVECGVFWIYLSMHIGWI